MAMVASRLDLVRFPDWSIRLYDFHTSIMECGTVLDWTYTNCASYTSDAVEAITGVNPYKELGLDLFQSEAKTYQQLRKLGVSSMEELFGILFEEVPVALAKRGDVALVSVQNPGTVGWASPAPVSGRTAYSLASGIVDDGCVYTLGPDGRVRVPFEIVAHAYRVGSI